MYTSAINTLRSLVALRKESVDRNDALPEIDALKLVALRKESVDRNANILDAYDYLGRSLSARRAWIEICVQRSKSCN